ncbi:MAG: GNAT family N-acetyltransferase, partial [Rhodanobacteraceae bacterium]
MHNREAPSVRRADSADAAQIARLATELGYPSTDRDIESRLEAMLPSSQHFIAVAEDADLVVGWVAVEARLLLVSGRKAELMGLVVGSTARRRGVGKALVLAAERWAMDQGFDAITVRSNITRGESHTFYERIGYTRHKTQHVYSKALPARLRRMG